MCCSTLQCAAFCCNVLQCLLQYVAVCCSVLQCVAVCCGALLAHIFMVWQHKFYAYIQINESCQKNHLFQFGAKRAVSSQSPGAVFPSLDASVF